MSKFCRHIGRKVSHGVFRGRTDTKLVFCEDCGQPIMNNVVDVAAYINNPRKLVNGKIVPEYLTIYGKIDFILTNARLLNSAFPLSRGRPSTSHDDSFEKFFFLPRDMVDLPKLGDVEEWHDENDERVIPFEQLAKGFGSGRMPGKTYVRLIYWAQRFHQIFGFMMNCLFSIANSVRIEYKQGKEDIFNGAFLQSAEFLAVVAKAGLKLKKSNVKAVYASALVNAGLKYIEVAHILKVKYETVKIWQSYLKAILKKTEQFKNLSTWPPTVGIKIKVKNGAVVQIEPSILKDEKVPPWVKIKDGKLFFEK